MDLTCQFQADHFGIGDEIVLPQQGSYSFDPPYTPADHADSVDHRRVRVCSHQRIRKKPAIPGSHSTCKVFQVHLMTNPHTRWNHSKVFKSILCPLQQLVTLSVSTVLHLHILFIGVVCSVIVDLNRMVDNQVHRNGWIDLLSVTALPYIFRPE